jgi:hypothetical protein
VNDDRFYYLQRIKRAKVRLYNLNRDLVLS